MRWWKSFREDADRPAFQAGIERYGTGFVHDLARVWQSLCVEEGPGIRRLELTPEMLGMFARQFRCETKEEAFARIEFMSEIGLVEIRSSTNQKFLTSNELKRRRDEWSRRKSRDAKKKDTTDTPESLRSHSRETPEQKQSQSQEYKVKKQSTDVNDVNERDDVDGVTGSVGPCCLKAKDVWEFAGIDLEKVPRRFKGKTFLALVEKSYEQFRNRSHKNQGGECDCYPDDLLGDIRELCKSQGVEYPPALLARQIEIERENTRSA